MKSFDAIVAGGGFAGLSCAAALAAGGRRVLVLEKKPHLGGRAFSFKDPETQTVVDNGQHLFMGCYRETRRFLKLIGTEDLLAFSPAIRVDYADADGGRDRLTCPTFLPSPLHLAAGVAGLKGLGWGDKLRLGRLTPALKKPDWEALDRVTVRSWLDSLGQTRRAQERFFDPIALGALNDDPAVAAATGFAQVLRRIFFTDVESTRLGISSVGLSDLYTGAAQRFIEARGGAVRCSAKTAALFEAIDRPEGRHAGVRLESGEEFWAPAVVSTLPPWDLAKLGVNGPWEDLKPAPIVSLTLWLDRPVIEEPLVGMLGTEIQWAFKKGDGRQLALVISGAHRHVSWDPKALLDVAQRDMSRCFPSFKLAKILRWKAIKEPFATLSPAPGAEAKRPRPGLYRPGLYLAGDWTRTDLPATIESACVSGHKVAEAILRA
jgi:hydroxysqualene dehydroxylase